MQDIYSVKNRSAGMVVYTIPEANIRREFAPGETKKIKYEELEKLTYQSGGRELMANFLQVDKDVTDEFSIRREPEYNMSEKDIIGLLQNGSLDAFLDCLDFAPAGVIDLVKKFSISLPLNDLDKRRALKEKTGFDVTTALANQEKDREDDNGSANTAPATRRVKTEDATTGRRTSGYKVISKSE